MILDAFDDYWGGKPPAQRLVFKIVPEFAARLAGIVSGEFDFIVNIPTDQEKVIEGYSNLTVTRKQADNYPAFAFNVLPDPPDNPLVDPNLRYAIGTGDRHGRHREGSVWRRNVPSRRSIQFPGIRQVLRLFAQAAAAVRRR